MFSTKKQLIKKTGKHGVGRFSFLQQLVNEYNATKSQEAKEQVIANLANFAYDPVNYDYLWRLRILDLFFSALEENNKKIISFAIGGICNICLEPLSRQYILRIGGIKIISSLLSSSDESIILSVITTLIFLDTPTSRQSIVVKENIDYMLEFSKSKNPRIKNLAHIFLNTLCNIDPSSKPNKRVIVTTVENPKRQKINQTITSVDESLNKEINIQASTDKKTSWPSTSTLSATDTENIES